MERKVARLETIRDVVMDEADEMLNMGFTDSINAILEQVPEDRNTLMFSATMSRRLPVLLKLICIMPKKSQSGQRMKEAKRTSYRLHRTCKR